MHTEPLPCAKARLTFWQDYGSVKWRYYNTSLCLAEIVFAHEYLIKVLDDQSAFHLWTQHASLYAWLKTWTSRRQRSALAASSTKTPVIALVPAASGVNTSSQCQDLLFRRNTKVKYLVASVSTIHRCIAILFTRFVSPRSCKILAFLVECLTDINRLPAGVVMDWILDIQFLTFYNVTCWASRSKKWDHGTAFDVAQRGGGWSITEKFFSITRQRPATSTFCTYCGDWVKCT